MDLPVSFNEIWFLLIGVLLTGYACLDGFDLGVGSLHLLTKSDRDRRIFLNAIGPVWDGNEVWLVVGGGALFAAFPKVYASVFSGFYIAFMLFLLALISRAASIEFRSKEPMGWWRQLWDIVFSLSSILASILLGVALGNLAWGIPLTAEGDFAIGFLGLLHPYSLLVGLTTLALFMLHGNIYLLVKTEGDLQTEVRRWFPSVMIFFLICFVVTTLMTLAKVPRMTALIREYPVLGIFSILNLLAIVNLVREVYRERFAQAFFSSCMTIVTLLILFALGTYPNFVYSAGSPEYSLTIFNASSSDKTLTVMLVIVAITLPFVLAYTAYVHWVFRGKVRMEPIGK
ncbi:MAG: cytochrome d ubiquinol oxidase subunit II [Candidatus Omnitrophica bacterium]|nr:cytochrome d ubiquinol oxidase subunit II [Candidatus Omnitrophota bacterium]